MRLAALIQKPRLAPTRSPPAGCSSWPRWRRPRAGPRSRARSIAPGKRADLVVLDLREPHLHPRSAIRCRCGVRGVRQRRARCVRGREPVVLGHELLTAPIEEIVREPIAARPSFTAWSGLQVRLTAPRRAIRRTTATCRYRARSPCRCPTSRRRLDPRLVDGRRMRSPKLDSADDRAQTCSSPVEIVSGYSGSSERSATTRAVPPRSRPAERRAPRAGRRSPPPPR